MLATEQQADGELRSRIGPLPLQFGSEHLFGILRAFFDAAALKKNRAVVSLDFLEHSSQVFALPVTEQRHKNEQTALKERSHRQQRKIGSHLPIFALECGWSKKQG